MKQLNMFDLPPINKNINGLTEADIERLKRAEPRAFYSFGCFIYDDEGDEQ